MNFTTLPDTAAMRGARTVCQTLRDAGFDAYFVGGCVRDLLLGREVNDIDIATSATPGQIETLFQGRTLPVGKAFGVMLVKQDGGIFETATFRTESDYTDGRHPGRVAFATPREDAQRRDFTVNGLFLDPQTGGILDFTGGLDDLRAKILRTIGDPEERFREDHLRLLRAVRFSAVLGFTPDPATRAAVEKFAPLIRSVSPERIAAEFFKLLTLAPRAGQALALLGDTGLLREFLPEVEAFKGCEQPPQFHPEGDVWTHTRLMLDDLPPPPRDLALTLGTLFHDLGKPETLQRVTDAGGATRLRFYNHAAVGAVRAREILARLRQSNELAEEVAALVCDHMTFHEMRHMRRATLRRFMGAPAFEKGLELNRLDLLHSCGDLADNDYARGCYKAFTSEPVLPEPWVRGRDLVAAGRKPGPDFAPLLKAAYDAQLENRFATKGELLAALLAGRLV